MYKEQINKLRELNKRLEDFHDCEDYNMGTVDIGLDDLIEVKSQLFHIISFLTKSHQVYKDLHGCYKEICKMETLGERSYITGDLATAKWAIEQVMRQGYKAIKFLEEHNMEVKSNG